MFFGDDEHGHVVARSFSLDDHKARGFRNQWALVVVSPDKLLLWNSFAFLERSLNVVAERLIDYTKQVRILFLPGAS